MYRRILVPVDGSPISKNGLAEAVRLAKATGARLRILHVVAGAGYAGRHDALAADADIFRKSGKKLVDDIVGRLRKDRVKAEGAIVENLAGRAADSIIRQAQKWPADAIVMGTHGRRGFRRFLFGGDAEIVLRSVDVPVLLVRQGGRTRRKTKASAGARRRS